MSARQIALVGAGGHAAVVAETIAAAGGEVSIAGYLNATRSERLERLYGLLWLGPDEELQSPREWWGVIAFGGLGTSSARRSAFTRLSPLLAGWHAAIHPSATVARSATVGRGSVVFAGAVINPGAAVGEHCIINTGAIVEHDVRIGDHTQLAPRVTVGGGAAVGADAYIGLGAVIRDHVIIGEGAVVGMGSVVVADVPGGTTVLGVPARARS